MLVHTRGVGQVGPTQFAQAAGLFARSADSRNNGDFLTMPAKMSVEIAVLGKGLVAEGTNVRFFARMDAQVHGEWPLAPESFATELALQIVRVMLPPVMPVQGSNIAE